MFNLDHITIVSPSLEIGNEYVARQIGVYPPPGGAHPQMGTHNHLLRLGEDIFLEVVAIDPNAAKPSRSRWFGLDKIRKDEPCLTTWVIRTDNIQAAIEIMPKAVGEATEITRGQLAWQISVPNDGSLPMEGAHPTIIEWPSERPHPASDLADLGCNFEMLLVRSPFARAIKDSLARRLVDSRVLIEEANYTQLTAKIRTPTGILTL